LRWGVPPCFAKKRLENVENKENERAERGKRAGSSKLEVGCWMLYVPLRTRRTGKLAYGGVKRNAGARGW
jgi:hypothetical protein